MCGCLETRLRSVDLGDSGLVTCRYHTCVRHIVRAVEEAVMMVE